ncbi:nicotinate-nicotinamide nucleotide adenylyltransferase [Miltoncostaea marina]|uniref:nicotinate-nicotinamide nucleotide adenylyltransferase n=1 Tax=Miltoncostaea marina TaxID=2843215 RepID=UPI001FE5822C
MAREALWQLGLAEVRLVPARRPPHKERDDIADPELRAELLQAAVAGVPGLVVSRAELERPAPSYTAETLEAMAAAEPGRPLWFILGADQLDGFTGWHRPRDIVRAARLAVVARGDTDRAALAALAERVAPGRADLIDVPRIDISSTMIRERIAAGIPVDHLMPQPVGEALRRRGLVPSPTISVRRKEQQRPRSS